MSPVVLLFCIAVLAAGVLILTKSAGVIWHCQQSSRWPTTPGTLLEVEDQDLSGPEDTYHRIRVRYTYVVEGVCHEGTSIHPGYVGGSRYSTAHSALLAVLQPGQQYRIHYNRSRPDESTLAAGLHLPSMLPLLIGIQLVLFAAAMMAEFGMDSGWGSPLFVLCGVHFGATLLLLLIGRDRISSRITRFNS